MKNFFSFIFLLLVSFYIYGQQLPLEIIAPSRSVFFNESTGRAIVNSGPLTFWLYQTSPDNMWELIRYLHSFVESIGYVIDYDSFSGVIENPHLERSVRSLMFVHNRNIAVSIWQNYLLIDIDTEMTGPIDDRKYFLMAWRLEMY